MWWVGGWVGGGERGAKGMWCSMLWTVPKMANSNRWGKIFLVGHSGTVTLCSQRLLYAPIASTPMQAPAWPDIQ